MKKVTPHGEKVLIEPLKDNKESKGGILLPDVAQQRPTTGKVLAVGAGRMLDNGKRTPLSVKVGDIVLFSKYGGSEVTIDRKDLMICNEDSIHAILPRAKIRTA